MGQDGAPVFPEFQRIKIHSLLMGPVGHMNLEEITKLAVKCLVKALEARQLPARIKIAKIPISTKKIEMLNDDVVEGYITELGSSK